MTYFICIIHICKPVKNFARSDISKGIIYLDFLKLGHEFLLFAQIQGGTGLLFWRGVPSRHVWPKSAGIGLKDHAHLGSPAEKAGGTLDHNLALRGICSWMLIKWAFIVVCLKDPPRGGSLATNVSRFSRGYLSYLHLPDTGRANESAAFKPANSESNGPRGSGGEHSGFQVTAGAHSWAPGDGDDFLGLFEIFDSGIFLGRKFGKFFFFFFFFLWGLIQVGFFFFYYSN